MLRHVKRLLPRRVKSYLRKEIAALKRPAMIYGYTDASGKYRPKTRISDTALIYSPEKVFIEDNVFIGHYNILDGTGGLEIQEGVQFAACVGIFTHGSHISIRLLGRHYQDVPEGSKPGYQTAPVKIGKYVYAGAGAKILPGVTIGDGALIAAGSIVSGDVQPFAIVRGNPAKVVGDVRKLDEPHLADERIRQWYEEWQTAADSPEATVAE